LTCLEQAKGSHSIVELALGALGAVERRLLKVDTVPLPAALDTVPNAAALDAAIG
jgi:hypothetical protein